METFDNAKKYLLKYLPKGEYLKQGSVKTVSQGYLRKDKNWEVKVVEDAKAQQYFIVTKKLTRAYGRSVEKIKITKEMYDYLYKATEGQQIYKERYKIIEDDFILKFDKFVKNTTKGNVYLLEVDVLPGSEKTAKEYELPQDKLWAKDAIDVTNDDEYLNQNLAN